MNTTRDRIAQLMRALGEQGAAIRAIGTVSPHESEEAEPTAKFPDWHLQDLRFQRRMLLAIRRGLERPPGLGAFVDETPFSNRVVFFRAPRHSGCSSAAALCAEQGTNNARPPT